MVKGATDKGVICYIKHFALNEREAENRQGLFTWSNEQAIREIYLKPFEIAVKKGAAAWGHVLLQLHWPRVGRSGCEALLTQKAQRGGL